MNTPSSLEITLRDEVAAHYNLPASAVFPTVWHSGVDGRWTAGASVDDFAVSHRGATAEAAVAALLLALKGKLTP